MNSRMTLPWPPTVNTFYSVAKGRKIISKRGRAFKKQAAYELSRQQPRKFTGKVRVEIYANPPDRRKRDLDNILKPLLDALTEYGAYVDDSDIDQLYVERWKVEKFGGIFVRVYAIQDNSSSKEMA